MNKNIKTKREEIVKPVKCLCPNCGYETYNEKGKYCTKIDCPLCKTQLINK